MVGVRPNPDTATNDYGHHQYITYDMTWGTVEAEPEGDDWLLGLSRAQFGQAKFYIDLFEERGPLLGTPYTRQLRGTLRDLRFYLDGDARLEAGGDLRLETLRRLGRALDADLVLQFVPRRITVTA
jgi:hypothetical protein